MKVGIAIVAALLLGGFIGAQWLDRPFGVTEKDVAERLVNFRADHGFSPIRAACHERSNGDRGTEWYCEVTEAVDDAAGADGYEEYIVRRDGSRWEFDRIPI